MSRRFIPTMCAVVCSVAWVVDDVRAQPAGEAAYNWHQWRGPEANGVSQMADPSLRWSESRNVQWKVALDGKGSSTPIIWGEKVFLLTAVNQLDDTLNSSPALAGNQLFLRGRNYLYCIAEDTTGVSGRSSTPTSRRQDSPPVESTAAKTRVHRLSNNKRAAYDAFAYVNRIPEKPEQDETAVDHAGRILGRLANQEGRVLLKLPPGMDRQSYLGFKTFLRYEGTESVGNCAACHTPADFTDLKEHVVMKRGSAKPTPSLRNIHERRVDFRKVILDKITASKQKRSGDADEIDDAYVKMNISQEDIPGLVAFLQLLDDVSDKEFRDLILDAEVLDTSDELLLNLNIGRPPQ